MNKHTDEPDQHKPDTEFEQGSETEVNKSVNGSIENEADTNLYLGSEADTSEFIDELVEQKPDNESGQGLEAEANLPVNAAIQYETNPTLEPALGSSGSELVVEPVAPHAIPEISFWSPFKDFYYRILGSVTRNFTGDSGIPWWQTLLSWSLIAGISLGITVIASSSVSPEADNGGDTPTITPPPSERVFVDAEAIAEMVTLLRHEQNSETLTVSKIAQLFVNDGLTVDEKGRAFLRFSNLLTIDVLRHGNLSVDILNDAKQSPLAAFGQSGGAFVNDLLPPKEQMKHLVNVKTEFAFITATGTRWLVAKERNTPLEWVIALDAVANDLTVAADGIKKFAPTGIAYWIAPLGGPSIPIDYRNVDGWLDDARSGQVTREIGDVLWPQADVITDTRSIRTYTETVAISGRTPPEVILGDVLITIDSEIAYELQDCNDDGIPDVYMERGGVIRFDFRGMRYRVRAIDAQVLMNDGSNVNLIAFNPNHDTIHLVPDVSDDQQLFSLRSNMLLQASNPKHEPFHYAELRLSVGCFLGFSLTPPNADDSPGPPRWPARRARIFAPTETPTLTPTVTVTPTPTPTATGSATPTPTFTPTPCTRSQPTGWITYVVMSGDTAENIASVHHISLQQLIRVNCLRPPVYIVQLGQELWVPPLPAVTPTPSCSTQAEIKLSVRKIGDDLVEIGWASNCFLTGTVAQTDSFATTPLTLIMGQNGSKQISLGRACRAGETFVIFELWYAAGQKRTVTLQVEC
jgi:LysM repeat protein